MAIHDLWSFDNAPVGVSLVQSSLTDMTRLVNSANNPYNLYTQLPGCIMLYQPVANAPTVISSDGFLTFTRTSSGNSNPLWVQLNQMFNFATSTKWAFGFRTKSNVTVASSSAIRIFTTANGYNGSLASAILYDGDVAAPANTEVYVEGIVDSVAQTLNVYVNGVWLRTATLTSAGWAAGLYLMLDSGGSAAAAGSTRGYRDFYFLDMDSTDTNRLGPIRSAPAVLASASGSEYTLNGSPASLLAALNTPLQNPPTATPNAQAPSDNQALTLGLSTSIASNVPIIAVQGQMTTTGDSSSLMGFAETFMQGSNQLNMGAIPGIINTTSYNRRSKIWRSAPDGGGWNASKINGSNLVLTPKTLNTVMLMHLDDYQDDTGRTWAANGNGVLTPTQSAYASGDAGAYNPSSTGFLSVAGDASLVLGAAMTVEFWIYRTAALGDTTILSCKTANSSTGQTTIGQQAAMGLGIYLTDGAGWKQLAPSSAFTLNKWTHCAVVYANGVYTGYIGGVAQGTVTSALTFGLSGGTWTLGGNQYNTSSQFPGYIDELRISNVARYTTSFQPPASPFVLD
jgi:hypothetical protein